MRVLRSLLLPVVALALAVPAVAQNPFQSQVQVAPSGPAWDNPTAFGFLVGGYPGRILSWPGVGAVPGTGYQDFYCVDLGHRISQGASWYAWISQVGGGDLTQTRLGNAGLGNYTRAAYLAGLFDQYDQMWWGGIHAQIWKEMGNYTITSTMAIAASDFWNHHVALNPGLTWEQAVASVNTDYWYVVSDVDGQRQEFLTYVTPEPETIFLLGTGLVAVFGMTIVMRRSLG